MNKAPKTFWHKSWPTPPWFRIWLLLLALTLVIMTCLIASRSFGFPDWPMVIIVPCFSLVVATLLLILWLFIRWFGWFCWHHWRRALFLLACVATAIALFYAEENWRGSHAWNQFQRQLEAHGVPVDFASVVPPPVPADQNFALTPLVASSYAFMIDPNGHEIRPHLTNVVNRLSMHYWLDGDHWDPAKLPGWMNGNRTDLMALQQYYRTLATKTNNLHLASPTQPPAVDILQALSRFDADIKQLRQDSQLPASRFPLEYDKENPAMIMLPHLAALKCAAQTLSLRATAELATGGVDQALADIKLSLRLIESVHSEPFLITHLVRIAMLQITLQPVWESLADHRWNGTQLAELDAELGKLDFLTDYQTAMRSDGVFVDRNMDYVRRYPDQYFNLCDGWSFGPKMVDPKSDLAMSIFSAGHLVPHGWYEQNKLRYARDLADFYQPAVDVTNRLFMPALIRQGDAHLTNECQHLSPCNILECLFLQWPMAFDTGMKFAHGQSCLDLARVAIALEHYRLDQGHFPDSLTALAPQYLNPLPHDIIGGQPLHYRLTPEGQFVLYSIGWNERDDGGVSLRVTGDLPESNLDQGDWVWRFPQN